MCALYTSLPTLTRRCVYHVMSVLHESYATEHQALLVGETTAFCAEIESACCGSQQGLALPSDVQALADGGLSVKEFCARLEEPLLRLSCSHPNIEALHDACFRFYTTKRRAEVNQTGSVDRLSLTCMYRLWLVFNVLIGCEDSVLIPTDSFRDLLKRLHELSGLVWVSDPLELAANRDRMSFSECLRMVTAQFERMDLRMPLTCEMIEDVYDEFVCGVQMKGYLVKQGHVRKNFKRRWFILRRTGLTYYESRQVLSKKGQIILSKKTEVEDIPDTKKLTCGFKITCAMNAKSYLLFADTQKAKHLWITAINKAVQETKLSEEKDKLNQSGDNFYTLKYGQSLSSPRKLTTSDHYEEEDEDATASSSILASSESSASPTEVLQSSLLETKDPLIQIQKRSSTNEAEGSVQLSTSLQMAATQLTVIAP